MQELEEAYNWLCALNINSETEAYYKEIILDFIDKHGMNKYRSEKERLEAWKIK